MERKISIIIPVYNCKNYLERAINSVINQGDFSENEIILIDDGSSDGSETICDRFADNYENISVIHQKNTGVSVARNVGISRAVGKWIFFLDSDDYLLENVFNNMLNQGDADLIYASFDTNSIETGVLINNIEPGLHSKNEIKDSLLRMLVNSGQVMYNCWAKLFKRSIIISNNISFPVGQKYAEDMVFVYTYLKYCETLSFVDNKVYYYYVNNENTTSVVTKGFDVFLMIYKWKTEYFKESGCYDENIKLKLESSFLYQSFLSIKASATYMKFFDAVKYINKVLNNDTFYPLFSGSEEYKSYKTNADKLFVNFINNKNAFCIVVLYKLLKIKSKLIKSRG